MDCKESGPRLPTAIFQADTAERATFLTTHAKRKHPGWAARTVVLPGWQNELDRIWPNPGGLVWNLRWGWKLFRASRDFDAVITGSEHVAHVFAALQWLLRRPRRRVVHVLVDFPWAASPGHFTLTWKRIQMRVEARTITRIVAHGGPEEIERFSQALRMPKEKFSFVPYHHTLHGSDYCLSNGGYIFAGGDATRDYATLIRAVSGTGYRTIICARSRSHFNGIDIPDNVKVLTASVQEFDRLMAGATLVVIPLPRGPIHTGGHTVIANAMTMGKPLIIAGSQEYHHFIQHEETGLLLPPGNPEALRDAVTRILQNPGYAKRLGDNARLAAAIYTPEAFFQKVFHIADEALKARRSSEETVR